MITRQFPRLFLRQGLRAIARHPILLLLNLLGIALGVAVFLAVQIANRSANESLRAGVDLVAGRANLEVRGDIDETLLPRIARLDGVRAATPVVEGLATLPAHPGEYLRILGVDPFSGAELRTFELLGADRAKIDLETWLREPDAIAISPNYARNVLPKIGNPLRVRAGDTERNLRPLFTLEPAATGDSRIAAMDIGWAQELLHKQGRLSTILLLVAPEKIDAVRSAIRRIVPADAEVSPPSLRSSRVETMLAAFQLNLTALSLVSVLIGAFLIYNTISASVVRRRVEIGILRALGASCAEIRLLFLGEAAVSGLAGSLLGSLLALPLAGALSAPIAQTVRSLYILTSVERLYLSPWQFVEAFVVGLGASLLAAWMPANEAARARPAQALHPGMALDIAGKISPGWLAAGAAALGLASGIGWAALHLHAPLLGFVSAFFVLAGFSLFAPAAIRAAARLSRQGPPRFRLAATNLDRSRSRNAVTVAALAAAIAMSVSVAVMIHSFRASVDDWIESTLTGDLFIGVAEPGTDAPLPQDAARWLRGQPGVRNVAARADTQLLFRGEPVDAAVLDGTDPASIRFTKADPRRAFTEFLGDETAIVSEPFANRFGLRRGDTLELASPRGSVALRVAGVFQDYARSNGLVMIQRRNFDRHWRPLAAQSLALTLDPAADAAALEAAFREKFRNEGPFAISSNRALKARVFDIFDQTFAVTVVLRAISVVVAVAGVTLALLILGAEREREIGVLRSIGASRTQVAGLFLCEAGWIGALASVVGVASGACLAMVLTWVVNKAFFGWTIQLAYPPGALLATPLWIIPVAMLAALLPAWQAASKPPARAVRFE